MTDPFSGLPRHLTSPATKHFAITPSDTVDMAIRPRIIRVGVAGNMVVVDEDGTAITYAVSDGEMFLFSAVRINATNTTATGLVGWY